MNLGLLADIHECTDVLQWALRTFRQEGVEQVVVLGDVCESGRRMEETCRLLAEANAVGVWGNHDFGHCVSPSPELRERYSPDLLEFMRSLQPRLEIESCYFSQIEPWLNSENFEDLWYFDDDGIANTPSKLQLIFGATPQSVIFAGHYHQWLLASETGIEDWHGERPVRLAEGSRYFVVVHAICDGYAAVFDTESRVLTPIMC